MFARILQLIKPLEINCIVAIARGGLIPATILSYELPCQHIEVVNANSYVGKDQKGALYVQHKQLTYIEGRRILLVDDIADTGETLLTVKEWLETFQPLLLKTITWYYKPRSIIKPDYYGRKISNEDWITFPWEKQGWRQEFK